MQIDIAAISLDVKNYRHAEASSEPDAMRFLLNDEREHKVTELANDIVEQKGLDPSSLLIVTGDESQPGRYIALEGNRRITALKTLLTPDLARGSSGHSQFKALHQRFMDLNITTVDCVVLDRDQAGIWIKRKHYKSMGGAGVLSWNAVATARSDASEGRFTRWMTALAYLEENGVDAERIRDSIASKTTTVERVLTSPNISSVLGLTFGKQGSLVPENGDIAAAVNLIQALLETMSDSTFVETRVSSAAQQRSFIDGFLPLSVKTPVVPPTSSGSPLPSSGTQPPATGIAGQPAPTRTAGPSKPKSVLPRKKLAKVGLKISNGPLNKFYSELRGLDADKNPHISAAIIRVFVEKSSTLFLDTMGIPPLNVKAGSTWHDYGVKFRQKVAAVLTEIDPSGTAAILSYARDLANGNRDKLHTTDHLNHAVHSHHALPSHSEIITIWDRFEPYLSALFDAIENKSANP